ncbi:mitochondrial import inner membrane translocase subunit TIM44-2 isoform X2 [Impatiens glandulifera]|uniref:mitochondrial import inner membrane translocase subunit TIM44-2 isoform X2 n=1 Tax=Impatiens glandulifera TaxID=253017 RepID=UPI001FB120FF|nr:mitochondrial import inner membrane translocase subunit TIM44-2 isoform X2 [Impatiens glandulifera]
MVSFFSRFRCITTNRQYSVSIAKVLVSDTRLRLPYPPGFSVGRQFSVFNEFSKQVKGEATRSDDFQKTVKELKEKAEELKVVKEDLKVRTKQTTEKLYKHVDGVWTEAEATAKKVSATMKDKIAAATEEVKGSFGIGKQQAAESQTSSAQNGANVEGESKSAAGEEKQQTKGSNNAGEAKFGKFKSSFSPKVSLAFQKLQEANPFDLAKKGYDIVKDELSGNPHKRKHIEYEPSTSPSSKNVERSTRTDITIVPSNQSKWSKKWDEFKDKMNAHPIMKRINGISKPVVEKSHDLAEDVREMWETSDNPVVHKIQDINESVFGESHTAVSVKEIRRRDPSFSLPDFVAEVQDVIRPVLGAYIKGDVQVLKKYCCKEVIERCKAEKKAYESQGIFFDNKLLHISDVEVRETKMMGDTPIIIVAFQTQQVYCVRDRLGAITEGGKDTIHTVYYAWAMQQIPAEEVGEGAIYPIWRLREMQQFGVQALI